MISKLGVVGAGLWTKRLAGVLAKHTEILCSPIVEISALNTLKLANIFYVPIVIRVGFRPGQLRPKATYLDLICLIYLLFKKDIVFYWTGSDVDRTRKMFDSYGLPSRLWSIPVARLLVRKSRHCAAAPWLVDELASIGIEAYYLPFPSPTRTFEDIKIETLSMPKSFTVLTYIPDHNPSNYCGEEIISVAKELSHINFRIMGGLGEWCDSVPANVVFLGWIDPKVEYLAASVLVRAVKHDALGGTVREALLCGRHVFYSFPHEHTIKIEVGQDPLIVSADLKTHLEKIYTDHVSGALSLNTLGREWIQSNLTEEHLAKKAFDYFDGLRL